MEKFSTLKPNVNLPPPVDTQALVAAILFFRYEDHYTGKKGQLHWEEKGNCLQSGTKGCLPICS